MCVCVWGGGKAGDGSWNAMNLTVFRRNQIITLRGMRKKGADKNNLGKTVCTYLVKRQKELHANTIL